MQAGQLTIANPNVAPVNTSAAGGYIGGWFTRLFGCWHREMSRPFSRQGQAYRSCLNCGAQRRFDLRNWETQGDFYYHQPKTRQLHALDGLTSVRRAA